MRSLTFFFMATVAVSTFSCSPQLSQTERNELAAETYIYGYSAVAAYISIYNSSVDTLSPRFRGKINQYSYDPQPRTAEKRINIVPNADTPYGYLTLDLRQEPYVLSLPDVEPDRYFSVQITDMYLFNTGYLGKVARGNKGGKFMIAKSKNDVPESLPIGIDSVIIVETPLASILVRTQLYNNSDVENIIAINEQIKAESLSQYMDQKPKNNVDLSYMKAVQSDLRDMNFYRVLDYVLAMSPSTNAQEKKMRTKIEKLWKIGSYDSSKLAPEISQALEYGIAEGFARLDACKVNDSKRAFGTRSTLAKINGDSIFFFKSLGALRGIYGNDPSEAVYQMYFTDSEGKPLNSQNRYIIDFKGDDLPAVDAFWSVTMYGADKFFVDNAIDRYLINSRLYDNGDLSLSKEGGFTIYIQNNRPTSVRAVKNWLPSPKSGNFFLVLRLYAPQQKILNGEWRQPDVIEIK